MRIVEETGERLVVKKTPSYPGLNILGISVRTVNLALVLAAALIFDIGFF